MEVIAQQTDNVFLVKSEGSRCFVVDLKSQTVTPHANYQVVLKWGYWYAVTAEAEKQAEVVRLAQA